jgi:hypothetical protein
MLVKELVEYLLTFPQDYSLIGQYEDSNGTWPVIPIKKECIGKVGPNSSLVYFQLIIPEHIKNKKEPEE